MLHRILLCEAPLNTPGQGQVKETFVRATLLYASALHRELLFVSPRLLGCCQQEPSSIKWSGTGLDFFEVKQRGNRPSVSPDAAERVRSLFVGWP